MHGKPPPFSFHFATLEVDELISMDPVVKTCALLVRLSSTEHLMAPSVLLLERMAWTKESVGKYLSALADAHPAVDASSSTWDAISTRSGGSTQAALITPVVSNDCYHRYQLAIPGSQPDVQMTIIHPATEAHVAKYRLPPRLMLCETPCMYTSITRPYYQSLNRADLKWIDNILDGHGEQEEILLRTDDFIVMPDIKWDRQDTTSLYLLALYRQRDLLTLRDLRQSHLPMLHRLKLDIANLLDKHYGLSLPQVRIYLHYLPTYAHLHLHVVHCSVERPVGTSVGLAHLLDDVIQNIEFDGDWYAHSLMHVNISQMHPLYALWTTFAEQPRTDDASS